MITMDWIITSTICLSVLPATLCFNIDPVVWRSLNDSAESFGYQVVQRSSDLLVSAPLAQHSLTGRGQIYRCSTTSCREIPVRLPAFAVNVSLGLTLANDPTIENTLACGPTIPKDCKSITMFNGLCVEISKFNSVGEPVPSELEECQTEADIAFLLDGSGSVLETDFGAMKDFVKNTVRAFPGKDTKFAITQFSDETIIHYNFNTFDPRNVEAQIDSIRQLGSGTATGTAIREVVNRVFISPTGGSRPDVKKVLIVVTDGESNKNQDVRGAARFAERQNIVRFAIGVGRAFVTGRGKKDLDAIASSPAANHQFRVDNFDALDIIRENLQDAIFSIEGSQTSGKSLELEMSQLGMSAAYVPGGFQMGILGANQWKGGYQHYTNEGGKQNSYEPSDMKPDSYTGYSMAVANTPQGRLTIVGAPRYLHRGAAVVVQTNINYKRIDPFPDQTGQYFGAEVCTMGVDQDAYTDLILISAPTFIDTDREGRVYVCILTGLDVDCDFDSPSVLRGAPSDQGRFGSSLAVLPDLNTDGLSDLAIGAPLEDDGKGSIYIFHSEGTESISLTYSQRIAGSDVMSQLKFFGISISKSSFDLSRDSLPELAVGAKGRVVILRSKPIVMVEAQVSFRPNLIPTLNSNCSVPLQNTARVCFTMTRHSTVTEAQARIHFNLTLDTTRGVLNNRAYIGSKKQRTATRSTILDLKKPQCIDVDILIEACPDDALNSVDNELTFTFEGLPSRENLSPSLAQQSQTTSFHPLGFEINCGTDNTCIDNLKVDFNFSNSPEVKVGIDELLNVTVSVENTGENSYNTRVILTYPTGLSYRKFTSVQGKTECSSLDSEDRSMRGKTDCTVDKPILRSNAKAVFIVSYGIETKSQLDSKILITANATSGNQKSSSSAELNYKKKLIDVKYSIFVRLQSYNNFSHGYNNLQKPLQQQIVVTNDIRVLHFTLVIRVPIKLGNKDIWVDFNNFQISGCQRDMDEEPRVTNFVPQIKENKVVDCSVAKCRVFKCSRSMRRLESKTYQISANLSSGWIGQIGLRSAKFLLTSTASLEYDTNKYIFLPTGSNNNPPVHKIEAEVEVYPEPDFTKEIVGGSVGGLALLALITAGLYKAGFFKSKYKNMMKDDAGGEAEGAGDPGAEAAQPTLEQQT